MTYLEALELTISIFVFFLAVKKIFDLLIFDEWNADLDRRREELRVWREEREKRKNGGV